MGPGFLDHVPGATADDLPSNIQAIRAFLRACTARPLPSDDYEGGSLLEFMVVPPEVQAALVTRVVQLDDVLGMLEIPVLMTQGSDDKSDPPGNGKSYSESIPDKCRVLVFRHRPCTFPGRSRSFQSRASPYSHAMRRHHLWRVNGGSRE